MTACPDAAALDRFLDEGGDDTAISAHLGTCARCRDEVEQMRANHLLVARLSSSDLLGGSGSASGPAATPSEVPDAAAIAIDGYELHEEMSRGGQGIVFRATQHATSRPVALKVLGAGAFATTAQQRRFEREIELIATLDHPNVVAVYDSGRTEAGWLFYAMRLVEGETLDAWRSDERSRSACLDVFAQIADGVAHAHRHGVIHRDLKPANIIVDAEGRPQVLDFGLARADDLDDRDVTQAGSFLGTIAYASPEHVLGDAARIDVRSDVYALGVVLFEMLAGRRPFDEDAPLPDLLRTIAEEPAPLLRRFTRIDRDLETVVAKALAKDPDRRYQSVAAFADDVRRARLGRPIDARGDSAAYLLAKTVSRFRVPFAIGATVMAALFVLSVLLWVQFQRARTEAEKVREINVFLEDTLGSVESGTGGGDVTVRELLDESAQWIDIALDDAPEVAASIHATVGNSYRNLGAYDEAEHHLGESLRVRRSIHGAAHPDVALSLNQLAILRRDQGRGAEAERLFREGLQMRRATLGTNTLAVAYNLSNLAGVVAARGDFDDAEAMLQESLEIRRNLRGRAHADVAMAIFRLGELAAARGDRAIAIERHTAALAQREELLHEAHPDLARSYEVLALLLIDDRSDEAVRHARRCLALRQASLPPDHWRVPATESLVGAALLAAGERDQAAIKLRASAATLEQLLGADDPRAVVARRRADAL